MQQNEIDYYSRRLCQQEKLAREAHLPEVRAAHEALASSYAHLLEHGERPSRRSMPIADVPL